MDTSKMTVFEEMVYQRARIEVLEAERDALVATLEGWPRQAVETCVSTICHIESMLADAEGDALDVDEVVETLAGIEGDLQRAIAAAPSGIGSEWDDGPIIDMPEMRAALAPSSLPSQERNDG